MTQPVLVDPALLDDVRTFGDFDASACQNCGTCTLSCSLSEDLATFPRKSIRQVHSGLKDHVRGSLEPWLCYYCGDCSTKCPREAEPGEAMMTLRRYLTAQYDWTGVARLMYRSAAWELGMLVLLGIAVVLLFTLPSNFGFGLLEQSAPEAQTTVMLDRFAPKHVVHVADLILAAGLSFFLFTNAARMFWFVMRGTRPPLRLFVTHVYDLALHGLTQIRWRDCEDQASQTFWLRHLFLISGYATMLLLVVVFLSWFQVEDSSFHWTSLLGYYGTAALLAVTIWIIMDRIKKGAEMHKFSHLSDWLFPILLLLTSLSGILLHVFRLLDMAMPTYYMYLAHLAIAVPMLIVEVPFGKWSHLLYRPLAIYLHTLKEKTLALQTDQQPGVDNAEGTAPITT